MSEEKPPQHEPSLFERMKFVRDEIRFEHTVLGNRISAYLASQAFLMTAFAISARAEPRTSIDMVIFSFMGIPTLALLISFYIKRAVNETINRLKIQRNLIYGNDSPLRHITNELRPESDFKPHNRSLRYAENIPIFFFVAWLLVVIWGVCLLNKTRLVTPTINESTFSTKQTTN
jgi:hypothetical protein